MTAMMAYSRAFSSEILSRTRCGMDTGSRRENASNQESGAPFRFNRFLRNGKGASISRWSGALSVCAIVAIIRPAHADPRAVVELFTSQGCSSCPPADNIIGELAEDPSVIALSMPIDYWDYLGWKDTLADARFSARQKAYSQMRGDREVYTPQVVVNGSVHVIGSDRAGIEGAIIDTKKSNTVMSLPVSMTLAGKQLNVSVAASHTGAAASHGEI